MNRIPQITYCRTVRGISAVLLPWTLGGQIDFSSYHRCLERTWQAGLVPAINMDTGFANLLSRPQRHQVLDEVARVANGRTYVAGAFVEDLGAEVVRNYIEECAKIQESGGIPILFQSTGLTSSSDKAIVDAYRQVARECDELLGFELGTMFAPFGRIYSLDVFRELMTIPTLTGIKHSSLSRDLEWQRIELRNRERPEFHIYTGNDLAIDMIQWGSDYLLGLSAFYPEAFAIRDRYWKEGDSRFYELNDWLQYLGAVAFRDPVPAYKHDCAMFLRMRGVIESDAMPAHALTRPDSDAELLNLILKNLDARVT